MLLPVSSHGPSPVCAERDKGVWWPFLFFFIFIFLCFSITVYFQYYFVLVSGVGVVVRQPCVLQSVSLQVSSTHLALYIVIAILLTVFPMLHFAFPRNYHCVLHNLTQCPLPPVSTSLLFVSLSLFQFCLFVYFVL